MTGIMDFLDSHPGFFQQDSLFMCLAREGDEQHPPFFKCFIDAKIKHGESGELIFNSTNPLLFDKRLIILDLESRTIEDIGDYSKKYTIDESKSGPSETDKDTLNIQTVHPDATQLRGVSFTKI